MNIAKPAACFALNRLWLILLCFAGSPAFAQEGRISVTILNTPDTALTVILPVNGTLFPGLEKVTTLKEQHPSSFINPLTRAGLVYLVNNRKAFIFFLEPDQSYTIVVDMAGREPSFIFTGLNAEGQYLAYRLRHPNYQSRAQAYYAGDSTFTGIQRWMDRDAETERQQYQSLLALGKIDRAFYQHAVTDITYYYASVLSCLIYDHSQKDEFVNAWPPLFAKVRLADPAAFATLSFYDYADQYAAWYKGSYENKKRGIVKRYDTRVSNEYLIVGYNRYADNLPEPAREYMLARFLQQFFSEKKHEPELADLFHRFTAAYPQSAYTAFLQPEADEVRAVQARAAAGFTAAQRVPDNYLAIRSVDELAALFPGKTVYVDLWATWCGPCRDEFVHSAALKQFLDSHQAALLYISLDNDAHDTAWRNAIKFYNLAGTHIRASPALQKDLENTIAGGKAYGIPRYLIIRNGKIVATNALRPSSREQLYRQLGDYL